ncbi:MAG: AAA family ATPase [Euryarchaeota archaeon]|nr:AAA family ATPase [Euryarchaeota archaeon]
MATSMSVNRGSRKSLLTARERVLVHLLPMQKYVQDANLPRSVTQDGIAEAVDVGRNNVAKILQELEYQGTVEVSTKHVKGLPSVRKVYFLTHGGFEEAKELKEDLDAVRIKVIDLKGEEHDDEVGRLVSYLPGTYSFLELAMSVERGVFDSRSFHESKVKEERRFVDFTDKKPTVHTFFGRERELRELNELIENETTRAVVIFGIPGMGKTTLIAKFAQDVRDRTNVFWLKIHEWLNVKGLLKPVAEFLSQSGKKNLEWYLGQTETPSIGEVLQILITDMDGMPALIILDDVQKGEPSVKELISALMGVLDEIPSLRIVCAMRDLPQFYSRSLVVNNTVKEMQLDGLDKDSSVKMLRARSMPEDQVQQLIKITEGHPLFLELIDNVDGALGKNIRMFIDQEVVSKLEVAEKRIMNVAAVFRYPVIIDAFFITEEEMRKELHGKDMELEKIDFTISYETVDSLLAKSILHESIGRTIGMHDLLREFTYSRLTPHQKTLYHRAASKFYVQDSSLSSQVEALYHCIMGKEMGKAVEIAAGRGSEIVMRGYSSQFAPLLEKLLAEQNIKERDELLLLHAGIMELRGEYDKAIEEYRNVVDSLRTGGHDRLLAETHRHIGAIEIKRTRFDNSLDSLTEALRLAIISGDPLTLSEIHYDLGGLYERRGIYDEATEHLRSAEAFATDVGNKAALGKALYGQARVMAGLSDFPKAVELKKRALSVLERAGDINMMAKVCIGLANDLRYLGETNDALRYLEKAVDLANSVGDVSTLAYALSNMAAEYLERKDLEKAEGLIHQSTQLFSKLDDQMMLANMHMFKGFLLKLRGETEWSKEEFQLCLKMTREHDVPSRLSHWLFEIAKAYVEMGDDETALELFNESNDLATMIGNQRLIEQIRDEIGGSHLV